MQSRTQHETRKAASVRLFVDRGAQVVKIGRLPSAEIVRLFVMRGALLIKIDRYSCNWHIDDMYNQIICTCIAF